MTSDPSQEPQAATAVTVVPAAIGQWVLVAVLVWACLAALSYNQWEPYLFRTAYRDSLGHYVAGQLSRAASARRPVCLLVGLSTTRSDFKPAVLEAGAPSFEFISAASAGGSIYGIELILTMAEDLRVQPECLVLGLHPTLLKDRTLALWPAGYLDVLSPRRTVEFIPREVPEERTRALLEAGRRAVWPAYRLSQHLNRLLRDGAYRAQRGWTWKTPLPREEFERLTGDLLTFEEFEPPVTRIGPDALPGYRRAIDEQRLLDPAIYATPAHLESLRRVLSRSLQLAPVTVAVILPESAFARERMSPLADAPFQEVLKEFAGSGLTVVDDRSAMPDDSFDADFHLLPAPALTYSTDFIRRVAPVLERRAPVAGRVVLAGQSNALFVRPYLEAAYTAGRIDGFAQDGSRIAEWHPQSAYWKRLAPTLHQPMRAFVWWQGESDYREPAAYLAALRAFIDRVRREANDPNLQIVLCRVVDDPTPGWSEIRQAQETVAATDPRVVLVSSDDLPKEHPDWARGSAHLSPAGYRQMAQRVIDAMR